MKAKNTTSYLAGEGRDRLEGLKQQSDAPYANTIDGLYCTYGFDVCLSPHKQLT